MKSVLIKNGHVVDPKQNIDQKMNLYVEGGKIAALTAEEPEADLVIDADGRIVCPGFIDIHMHEDEYDEVTDTICTSMSHSALHMGVTLDIGGNCGDNVCDPVKFLDTTDRDGAPVNIGLLAGHTWLRNFRGRHDKYRPIRKEDIAEMTAKCRYCLDHGCLGVSFGVKYVPGSTWDEIIALARLCQKDDKLVSSHVRQDVTGVFDAADELARMGQEGKVKVQFSHIGSMGGYGQMKQLLSNIEGYRSMGIDMLCDCYPYDAFSTGIGETTYDDGFLESYQADYDSILIVNGKYAGQRCTKEIFEELRRDAPGTGTVGYFMKEEDVETALLSPLVMIGSDGIRTEGMGHPRASGSFPKFIREYIRTGKISLSDGVRKMTTMAADRLNLPHKGNFLPGSDADIVIFDLDRVTDRATYENGQLPSEGFDWVLIGGEVALKDDQIVNDRLGRSVRR
ncbi:MAG: amidohydrolase family protein [Firmicutes bacterium]|nr:amidohydrolase family protein [Bacillota bacterium]MDY5856113.1 amidohydrolase family protein [Anaerovoracaceae bacterium]